jgi:hypothetical protein
MITSGGDARMITRRDSIIIALIAVILLGGVYLLSLKYQDDHPWFTGNVSIGKPGEDGMPYGWFCYEESPHNAWVNEVQQWAHNERGYCEWR